MGSWFSNLHIRKADEITMERVCDCIKGTLTEKKYTLVECAQDADAVVAVVDSPNCQWVSLCAQVFAHDDPISCKKVAEPLSAQLHTDVLGIACFDSDYLYMNLINTEANIDAWVGAGAGKEVGITRRNSLTAWKKKVTDYAAFSAAAKCSYVWADELLTAVEGCLMLPAEQGSISLDYLENSALQKNTVYLYFRQEEGQRREGPDLRVYHLRYAEPCFDGSENEVKFLNYGEEFCGLSIYFLGPYVEQEEITFTDVKLGYLCQPFVDIELKKTQLPDGQWAYCCHLPDILMPPRIPERMKIMKRHNLETERCRKLTFVPHGNPRKMLDITVVITPYENPENQARWNVWERHGSKEAFVLHHNKIWKQVRAVGEDPELCLPFLNIQDFDD